MSVQPGRRKLRINPIEVMIFGVVAGIFLHSLVNLVSESREFKVASLTNAVPLTVNSERAGEKVLSGRSIASVPSKFASFDLTCTEEAKKETTAEKIRLSGSFCAAAPAPDDSNAPLKTSVVNDANHYAATLFQDGKRQNYSTDYIPLAKGTNPIRIEFTGVPGKSFSQRLEVIKN